EIRGLAGRPVPAPRPRLRMDAGRIPGLGRRRRPAVRLRSAVRAGRAGGRGARAANADGGVQVMPHFLTACGRRSPLRWFGGWPGRSLRRPGAGPDRGVEDSAPATHQASLERLLRTTRTNNAPTFTFDGPRDSSG